MSTENIKAGLIEKFDVDVTPLSLSEYVEFLEEMIDEFQTRLECAREDLRREE